jgi:peptidase M28-like protein
MLSPFRVKSKTAATIAILLFLPAQLSCYAQSSKKAEDHRPTQLDPARAFEHVKRLVTIGPHPSGSDGIKKAQEYIETELKGFGLKVTGDSFNADTPRGTVPMKNIIAELRGEKPDIVMITGHYDTKLQSGFVGANDGCSSAAAVLETARVLSKTTPEYTLWFVFFDGEEAVVDWNAMDGKDNTYGSRHLAAKLTADGTLGRLKALVLFDMVGDKDLDIKREGESTPWLVDAIWKSAHALGYQKSFLDSEQYISDDHLPFKDAGVPVVDLIDFNYGPEHSYWHTNLDTLDKISGESIKMVCAAVIGALPEIFKYLNSPVSPPRKPVAP